MSRVLLLQGMFIKTNCKLAFDPEGAHRAVFFFGTKSGRRATQDRVNRIDRNVIPVLYINAVVLARGLITPAIQTWFGAYGLHVYVLLDHLGTSHC